MLALTLFLAPSLAPLFAQTEEPGEQAEPSSAPGEEPTATETGAPEDAELEGPLAMETRFRRWLRDVEPLITSAEKLAFLGLERAHHRDAFIQRFWKERDPFPETARNELKERWEYRLFEAQSLYGGLQDDRARIYLVHGEPNGTLEVRCTTTRTPVEVWGYQSSDVVNFRFLLIFVRNNGVGPARIWRPQAASALDAIIQRSRGCINGSQLDGIVAAIRQDGGSYEIALSRVLAKPKPRSEEWLATFKALTTEIPDGTERFQAAVDFDFLGRHQSRTVVQSTLLVPLDEATLGEFAGHRSYDFQLTGEVVLEEQLFESFRYKYGFGADDGVDGGLPMAFQRYLRPGAYSVILKLEDLNSGRMFRHESALDVPRQEELADLHLEEDSDSLRLFREATEAVGSGETLIRIVPPVGELHSGLQRFDTIASGEEIQRVRFLLDGNDVLTKNKHPFNVEIDLGPFPRVRRLQVEALDDDDAIVARDELLLNAGEHRFAIRLVEPKRGGSYEQSLQARAVVEVPEDRSLERVEFYLGENLVATLYQEPFVQPIRLSRGGAASYVRAVAYLADANSTEDIAFVNSPDYLEEIGVQFVELYASALDRDGRIIEGLDRGDFEVFEDGVRQDVLRFSQVDDLPIHACILLDNSASMQGAVDEARLAALSFFQQAIQSKDRAAIITFNRFPNLAVKFTNDHLMLGGGLQGLTAEGQTALYDSLMFGLYYFSGIKGQRAILLLSDGKDEVSRFSFDETLEYAMRAGVTIYSIGLNISDGSARHKLVELANRTGGRAYFTREIDDLGAIYDLIQTDLRSQYLLAYQSHNTSKDDAFRTIELKVDRPGASVRTLSGYYP